MQKHLKILGLAVLLATTLSIGIVFASGQGGVLSGTTIQESDDPGLNEGTINFDLTERAYHRYTARLEPKPEADGYYVKGWGWNTNLGWVSFYCQDGLNTNRPCGDQDYQIKIDLEGNITGWAYGDNIGWISFMCDGGKNQGFSCGAQDYITKLDVLGGGPRVKVVDRDQYRYAWADSVGRINLSNVKFPWGKCAPGTLDKDEDGCVNVDSCTNEQFEYACGPDCDDDDPNVHPGATEVCDDNKDNDCDGLIDCNDPECAGGAGCDDEGGGPGDPGSSGCDLLEPDEELSCANGKDDDCDGKTDCNDPDCDGDIDCIGLPPGLCVGDDCFPCHGEDCPDVPLDPEPGSSGVELRGGISSQYFGLETYQSVGESTKDSLNVVKSLMRRNVKTVSKGIQKNTYLKTVDAGSLNGKNILYIDGDGFPYVTLEAMDVADFEELTPKTLIVEGADLIIDGDVTDIVGKLGIIVLKDLHPTGMKNAGGNIYIHKSVKEIDANIYADGTVFTYESVDQIYSDNNYKYNWECAGLAGEPKWGDGYDFEAELNTQLLIKGSLISRNSLGEGDEGVLPNDVVACEGVCGDDCGDERYDGQAKLYDLEFLRGNPDNKVADLDISDDSKSIYIFYMAPKAIPGFEGVSAAESYFGGF
jgi:hypothetical protein